MPCFFYFWGRRWPCFLGKSYTPPAGVP
jgi:hypothetical protein